MQGPHPPRVILDDPDSKDADVCQLCRALGVKIQKFRLHCSSDVQASTQYQRDQSN